MSGELKPCPFCGGEPSMAGNQYRHYVRCMECSQQFEQATEHDAAKVWNRRALPTPSATE